jgi:hypothetical protein
MAYLVILNNEADAGEKVMAVAPFEGLDQAENILADWAEMCLEGLEDFTPPFRSSDFKIMKEVLAEFFDVSVEVLDGM